MEAIKRIVKVNNHSITVELPANFIADEVEVIILPSDKREYNIPQWQIDKVRERTDNYLKSPASATDIDDFLKEIENEL